MAKKKAPEAAPESPPSPPPEPTKTIPVVEIKSEPEPVLAERARCRRLVERLRQTAAGGGRCQLEDIDELLDAIG